MATAEKGSPLRLSNRVRSSFAGSNIFCLSQTRSVKTLGLHWKTLLRLSCTLVSTLNWVLSAFGNCFENCHHAHFFSEASLAFVSGFLAHFSKSLENPAILESITFGQYKRSWSGLSRKRMERLSNLTRRFPKYISSNWYLAVYTILGII